MAEFPCIECCQECNTETLECSNCENGCTEDAFKCLPLHLGSGQSVVKLFCVTIVVSMEIFTMQNLDLEGKKLFNIYLH